VFFTQNVYTYKLCIESQIHFRKKRATLFGHSPIAGYSRNRGKILVSKKKRCPDVTRAERDRKIRIFTHSQTSYLFRRHYLDTEYGKLVNPQAAHGLKVQGGGYACNRIIFPSYREGKHISRAHEILYSRSTDKRAIDQNPAISVSSRLTVAHTIKRILLLQRSPSRIR
jgi:hypothetical protein